MQVPIHPHTHPHTYNTHTHTNRLTSLFVFVTAQTKIAEQCYKYSRCPLFADGFTTPKHRERVDSKHQIKLVCPQPLTQTLT